jgi:hypothetical protein
MTRVCFPIPTSSQTPPATRCDPVLCQNVDPISPNGSHYRRCFAFDQPTGKSDALVTQMGFFYLKKKKDKRTLYLVGTKEISSSI